MNGPYRRFRWARVLLGLVFAALVATIAYNAGVSHGLAQQIAAAAPGATPYPYAYPYAYPYPWHPWGFGLLLPLFALFIGFSILRAIVWSGARHAYGRGPCGGGRPYGVPPMFEEWHRRAHERDAEDGPGRATSV